MLLLLLLNKLLLVLNKLLLLLLRPVLRLHHCAPQAICLQRKLARLLRLELRWCARVSLRRRRYWVLGVLLSSGRRTRRLGRLRKSLLLLRHLELRDMLLLLLRCELLRLLWLGWRACLG